MPEATVFPQPDAPIVINDCFSGYGADFGLANYYLEQSVAFTNKSPKKATAVQFRFDYFDSFGAFLGTRLGVKSGVFSPGIRIDRPRGGFGQSAVEWRALNTWANIGRVVCAVTKVGFDDGTVWSVQLDSRQTGGAFGDSQDSGSKPPR